MAMKHQFVLDDLIDKISAHHCQPGDHLPSATALCEPYNVSKITVKKALDELETQGYISKRRGSGSFVKMRTSTFENSGQFEMGRHMLGFKAEHEAQGQTVTTEVRGFNVIVPPRNIAARLGMEPDRFAYRIVRAVLPTIDECAWLGVRATSPPPSRSSRWRTSTADGPLSTRSRATPTATNSAASQRGRTSP